MSRVIMDLSEEISRLHCSNWLKKPGSRLHIMNSTWYTRGSSLALLWYWHLWIHRIYLRQHPHCEGYNQNWLLFTLEERHSQFKVCYRNQVILMEGGAAHREEARLQLYIFPDAKAWDVILSKLSEIQHLFSCMKMHLSCFNSKHRTESISQSQTRESPVMDLIKICHLVISTLLFGRLNIITGIPENPNFFFSNDAWLDSKVTLDFYKLKQVGSTSAKSIGIPIEKVIVGQYVIVKVVADNTIWYGIELKNRTDMPFIHTPSSLTTVIWASVSKFQYYFNILLFLQTQPISTEPYLPPFVSRVKQEAVPPLRPNGSLTIRYCSNGSDKVIPVALDHWHLYMSVDLDVDKRWMLGFLSSFFRPGILTFQSCFWWE